LQVVLGRTEQQWWLEFGGMNPTLCKHQMVMQDRRSLPPGGEETSPNSLWVMPMEHGMVELMECLSMAMSKTIWRPLATSFGFRGIATEMIAIYHIGMDLAIQTTL